MASSATQTKQKTVVNKTAHPFDKAALEGLIKERFFYAPAFEIYGGEHPVSLGISWFAGDVCGALSPICVPRGLVV